jgi:hypothetical protein
LYVIEVRNDELMESLTRQVKERGITHGAIVSLIGAVDSFTVSTMPANEALRGEADSVFGCVRVVIAGWLRGVVVGVSAWRG